MRFYNQTHAFYCGVDLHARTMSYAYPKGLRETRDLLRRRMYIATCGTSIPRCTLTPQVPTSTV